MGWIDDDGRHEGYAAYVTRSGATTGTSGSRGVYLRRPDAEAPIAAARATGRSPENDDFQELIRWSDVIGWRAVCECGWVGPQWSCDEATWDGPDRDPDAALLRSGQTVDDAARDAWDKHIAPVRSLAAIEAAADRFAAARQALDDAVAAARATTPPASWSEIGRATGMARQSAHERWSQ